MVVRQASPSPRPIRVVVAAAQSLACDGLSALLAKMPDLELAAAVMGDVELVAICRQLRPRVALIDLQPSGRVTVDCVRLVRESSPDTAVLVLSDCTDEESVYTAVESGVRGYITKSSSVTELERAIRCVSSGGSQFDPIIQRQLVQLLRAGPPLRPTLPNGLSPREIDVVRLLAEGLSNHEIARALHLKEATVKSHMTSVLGKTGTRSRTQAAAYAFRTGLAPLGSRASLL